MSRCLGSLRDNKRWFTEVRDTPRYVCDVPYVPRSTLQPGKCIEGSQKHLSRLQKPETSFIVLNNLLNSETCVIEFDI